MWLVEGLENGNLIFTFNETVFYLESVFIMKLKFPLMFSLMLFLSLSNNKP